MFRFRRRSVGAADRGGNAGVQRHTHLRHLSFGIFELRRRPLIARSRAFNPLPASWRQLASKNVVTGRLRPSAHDSRPSLKTGLVSTNSEAGTLG
jgi:hypothetical protein